MVHMIYAMMFPNIDEMQGRSLNPVEQTMFARNIALTQTFDAFHGMDTEGRMLRVQE
jgi:hypothetical protein